MTRTQVNNVRVSRLCAELLSALGGEAAVWLRGPLYRCYVELDAVLDGQAKPANLSSLCSRAEALLALVDYQ